MKVHKARIGRNPNKPEIDTPILARSMVNFKMGKEMRTAVFKLPPKTKNRTLIIQPPLNKLVKDSVEWLSMVVLLFMGVEAFIRGG